MAGRRTSTPARRKLKVRSGDEVQVMAGKDRGKRGKVFRVDPAKERVFVEGLNIVKRHVRPQQGGGARGEGTAGGVIEKPGAIHVSNVMLIDPSDGKPTRLGVVREDGRGKRVAKRSGTRID